MDLPTGGSIEFVYEAPGETRAEFYSILSIFGSLLFLCIFTYSMATIVAAIVQEKETMMKDTLRIAGLRDFDWCISWFVYAVAKNLPLCIAVAIISRYGHIFPNQTVSETSFFFVSFIVFNIGFSQFLAVFVQSNTRVAALTLIALSFVFFFVTLSETVIAYPPAALLGMCAIPSLCLSWGVKYMFQSAAVVDGLDVYSIGAVTNLPRQAA